MVTTIRVRMLMYGKETTTKTKQGQPPRRYSVQHKAEKFTEVCYNYHVYAADTTRSEKPVDRRKKKKV